MFIGLPLAARYTDPWQDSFETRFAALTARRRRIAYYYTEPDNSTFRYRCFNMVRTVNAHAGDTGAAWFSRADGERLGRVADAVDVLILGRVRYDTPVARLVARARAGGARILFDVDDLVCDTRHIELLMNSLNQDTGAGGNWDYWYSYIARMGAALRLCDGVITTNAFLAGQIARDTDLPVSIVPNYLNAEQEAVSRAILTAKRDNGWGRDGLIHVGYFSGSPTHARDFAIVAPTLAGLLAADPRVVLRLVGMLDPHPALAGLQERIEVHPFTDFLSLQRLVGSTEISLAPLQDNIFTNSKSELKFFEAAVVGTLTIASPTFTFAQAIEMAARACSRMSWNGASASARRSGCSMMGATSRWRRRPRRRQAPPMAARRSGPRSSTPPLGRLLRLLCPCQRRCASASLRRHPSRGGPQSCRCWPRTASASRSGRATIRCCRSLKASTSRRWIMPTRRRCGPNMPRP